MACRHEPATFPPLDSGVMLVTKDLGQLPHTPKAPDYNICVDHTHCVRTERTNVNVEPVRENHDDGEMQGGITIGSRIRALYVRSGLSQRELASGMGYKNASSVQRYVEDHYDPPEGLSLKIATKLAGAVVGLGSPPIMPDEVFALAGVAPPSGSSASEVTPMDFDRENAPAPQEMLRTIPVYGPVMGASQEFIVPPQNGDGPPVEIEQGLLDMSDIMDRASMPPALARKQDLYAVYISGDSMSPRFDPGRVALIDPKRPAGPGDDVVVHLRGPNGQDGEEKITAILIKTLVRRSASWVELRQYNPAATFRIDMTRIKHIHRVVPLEDVLGL